MNTQRWLLISAICVVLALANRIGVSAQNVADTAPPPPASSHHLLAPTPEGQVIVWRNERSRLTAERIGQDMIQRGMSDPMQIGQMIASMVACLVRDGSPVDLISASDDSADVFVTSGPQFGCHGTVDRDRIVP